MARHRIRPRVLVVGLDCAPPRLVFDRFASAMPTLRKLSVVGSRGVLRSVCPPITVPAWACAASGLDPGELGVYGFRTRRAPRYALETVTSGDLDASFVWDEVVAAGGRAAALFVPPSYPPRPAREGLVEISCLLTPTGDAPHTSPASVADEISRRFGPYSPDLDPALVGQAAIDGLFAMARQHFDVAEHVLADHDPDLLFMVEIGTDRLNHLFWPLLDPSDPRYFEDAGLTRRLRDYYGYLDARIERLLERSGRGTDVLVVSDHGARPILGGVYVNELLRRAGLLVLRREPEPGEPFSHTLVDWSRTRAWGEGGYVARIFVNVVGRDAEGIVHPADRARVVDEIEAQIRSVPDPSGRGHRFVRPCDVYRRTRGSPPDAMVCFGDLAMRALGELGAPSLVVGPEDVERGPGRGGCNHDWDGTYVCSRRIHMTHLVEVAGVVRALLGLGEGCEAASRPSAS